MLWLPRTPLRPLGWDDRLLAVHRASDPIRVRVEGIPPAKDGAKSVLGPEHRDYPRVQALRAPMRVTMTGHAPFGHISCGWQRDGLSVSTALYCGVSVICKDYREARG